MKSPISCWYAPRRCYSLFTLRAACASGPKWPRRRSATVVAGAFASALASLALLGGTSASAKTYNVAEIASDFALTGSIVTDGHFGALSATNILDWNLSVFYFSHPNLGQPQPDIGRLTGPLSGSNSSLTLLGSALTADTFGLYFNFDDPTNAGFQMKNSGNSFPTFLNFGALGATAGEPIDGPFQGFFAVEFFGNPSNLNFFNLEVLNPPGNLQFAIDPTPFTDNATPLPAALPLFASGIGGLGLLGWRRKKKAATLAA